MINLSNLPKWCTLSPFSLLGVGLGYKLTESSLVPSFKIFQSLRLRSSRIDGNMVLATGNTISHTVGHLTLDALTALLPHVPGLKPIVTAIKVGQLSVSVLSSAMLGVPAHENQDEGSDARIFLASIAGGAAAAAVAYASLNSLAVLWISSGVSFAASRWFT